MITAEYYIVILFSMEYQRKEEIIKQFYEKGMPILASFEPERKKRLKRMICIESILVIMCALYFYNFAVVYNFFVSINSPEWLIITYNLLMFICAFAALIYPYLVSSGFKEDLKRKVMPKVIKSFGAMGHAIGCNIFTETELLKSTLFSRFNKMEADDSFCGEFDGVNFKILETELALQGRKYYSTSFKGVIVEFDSNKKIKAKTTVTTANDTNSGNKVPPMMIVYMLSIMAAMFIPFFQNIDSVIKYPVMLLLILPSVMTILGMILVMQILNKKMFTDVYNKNNKQIRLEDVKFAKKFKVFSEDEVEARYLVTTAFMERFLNLTTSFGTKKAKCAFYDDKVMFAISTRKNLFEFGSLFKTLENPKNVEFFNELMSILDMIDHFKLDENTRL